MENDDIIGANGSMIHGNQSAGKKCLSQNALAERSILHKTTNYLGYMKWRGCKRDLRMIVSD